MPSVPSKLTWLLLVPLIPFLLVFAAKNLGDGAPKYCDYSRKRANQLEALIRELRDKNYSVTMELINGRCDASSWAMGLFFFQWFKRPLDVARSASWLVVATSRSARAVNGAMHLFAYQ